MAKTRGDTGTLDLLAWQPPQVTAGFGAGAVRGGTLASRIARGVSLALKRSSKSREEVAKAMSSYLGEKVSRAMLDAYASEARTAHRIPLERFIALAEATGCLDLLGLVTEPFGHVVVPERYGAIIELHLIEEHEADLQRRKAQLAAATRRRP